MFHPLPLHESLIRLSVDKSCSSDSHILQQSQVVRLETHHMTVTWPPEPITWTWTW